MNRQLAVAALAAAMTLGTAAPAVAGHGPCHDTGAGLTANYVNTVPEQPFEVTCDVGIYLDEDEDLRGVSLEGTVANARPTQYGIYVDGADVDVSRSSITVADAYPHEFVSITYQDGATGTIHQSELRGAHRSAMVIRGEDTDVSIKQNTVEGSGPKTSGWAENGIQVDQGAAADIVGNTVRGHWWDGESNFGSSGILFFAESGRVSNNTLVDNEFGIYTRTDDSKVTSNTITSDVDSQSSFEFQAYGVLVAGSDNHLAGNRLTSSNGAVGFYILPGAEDNRLTGNRVRGYDHQVVDEGDGTVVRGMPSHTGA